MTSLHRRRRTQQALMWGSGLVFCAGLVAVLVVYLGGSGDKTAAAPVSTGPAITNEQRQNVKLDPEARQVAGRFILTAVAREDLAEGWELTHPELRQGLTREQWLTGNIPVQYYPADAIDTAAFKIDESYPTEAVLEVALIPKEGETVKPQIFFVGLKKSGGRWQVYYWAPRGAPAIPVLGDG